MKIKKLKVNVNKILILINFVLLILITFFIIYIYKINEKNAYLREIVASNLVSIHLQKTYIAKGETELAEEVMNTEAIAIINFIQDLELGDILSQVGSLPKFLDRLNYKSEEKEAILYYRDRKDENNNNWIRNLFDRAGL